MNRRDFLKVSSCMSAFSFAAIGRMDDLLNAGLETTAGGKLYRATSKGKVSVSKNGGKSWQLHSQFNSGYSILDIFTARDKQLYVHVSYKRVKFHLVLTKDGTAWMAQHFKNTPKPR